MQPLFEIYKYIVFTMVGREVASKYISNNEARILEFGPLNTCLLDRSRYRNYFFADIRSTEEVKGLYSGNEYLERTGIAINLEDIIPIDYVIKGSYKKTFENIEKFDYIIVSHVLEHIPDLLNFFIDIQNILKKNGELIILYPDKRFCFDYFRSDSKFADIYDVWKNGENRTSNQVLDFFTNVLYENDPVKFWKSEEVIKSSSKNKSKQNLLIYGKSLKGQQEEDVHYWPFSDYSFLKFLRDCKIYNIFPFTIKKFVPTQKNTQEFLVILSLVENKTILDIDMKLIYARKYYQNIYYGISNFKKKIIEIELEKNKLVEEFKKKNKELEVVQSNLLNKEKELVEETRVRNMVKTIFKKSLRLFKRLLLYIPNKILRK